MSILQASGGDGIKIIKDLQEIQNESEQLLVQRYIHNPLLINNKKFDIRIHFLMTSLDPLELYLHKVAHVKFAGHDYEQGCHLACNMHHKIDQLKNGRTTIFIAHFLNKHQFKKKQPKLKA